MTRIASAPASTPTGWCPAAPLVLGGVTIPHDRGLEGHSDGDCVLHAVCDALLGAAAAGDMGAHFPSADAALEGRGQPRLPGRGGAHGWSQAGYAVENVDVTVIAQAPRAGAARRRRCARASRAAWASTLDAVSVKAKSTDGLGALGRGEGIAAQAVVLLRAD